MILLFILSGFALPEKEQSHVSIVHGPPALIRRMQMAPIDFTISFIMYAVCFHRRAVRMYKKPIEGKRCCGTIGKKQQADCTRRDMGKDAFGIM